MSDTPPVETDCPDELSLENKAQLIEYATWLPEWEGIIAAARYIARKQIACLKSNLEMELVNMAVESLQKKEAILIDFFGVDSKDKKWISLTMDQKTKKLLGEKNQLIFDILQLRNTNNPVELKKAETLLQNSWDGTHRLTLRFGYSHEGRAFIRNIRIEANPDLEITPPEEKPNQSSQKKALA